MVLFSDIYFIVYLLHEHGIHLESRLDVLRFVHPPPRFRMDISPFTIFLLILHKNASAQSIAVNQRSVES